MSTPEGEEALPEHAYLCFETINAQLHKTEPLDPAFDDSLELSVSRFFLFSPFLSSVSPTCLPSS